MSLEFHFPIGWCRVMVYLKMYSDFEDNEKEHVILHMWDGPDI